MSVSISVVIPVYNGEKYINKAFESINNQSLLPFELIFVDDGSTDQSAAICDAISAKSSWIKVVHKKNGGLSSARNAGILKAEGSHIIFVDVDDYIENNTVESVTKNLEKYNPDLLDFGMCYVDSQGGKNPFHHKLPKNQLLGEDLIRDRIIPVMINVKDDPDAFIYDYSVNKVYKTNILKNNQVLFDENRRIWEDRPFVVSYLRFCKSYISLSDYFYNYCFTPGSLSQHFKNEIFNIIVNNYNLYYSWFGSQYNFHTTEVYNYWSRSVDRAILWALKESDKKEEKKEKIIQTLENPLVKEWYKNREIKSQFQRLSGKLIQKGNYNELLSLYKVKQIWNDERAFVSRIKNKAKGLFILGIHKIIPNNNRKTY